MVGHVHAKKLAKLAPRPLYGRGQPTWLTVTARNERTPPRDPEGLSSPDREAQG